MDWFVLSVGLVVGLGWAVVFGPWLQRVDVRWRSWFTYAVEAVGTFVIAAALESKGKLSALFLLVGMMAAGLGLFVVRLMSGGLWDVG